MNKLFTAVLLCAVTCAVKAQTPALPTTQPFGKVDQADFDLKSCDFEKDANAEVLFDKGSVYFDQQYNVVLERHVRVKIFNEKAKDQGSIRLEYFGGNRSEFIEAFQAETINLNNGKVEITKVDKKQIFTEAVDKYRTSLSFSFPNVQAGSIIEYKYRLTAVYLEGFPDWYFQSDIPTRYSEITTNIPNVLYYKKLAMVNHAYTKNTDDVKALANVPSLQDEPYMSSRKDNLDRMLYQLSSINAGFYSKTISDTWEKVGKNAIDYEDFGEQLRKKLNGEELILDKAKAIKDTDAKIAYIFNEVKNSMKWDDVDNRYTSDGTPKAWDKKTGNSTEINIILYHLLKKAGLKVYPMMVSTKKHGKVNPAFTSEYQFNSTVAYIPVDSNKYYVLDATSKFNMYNEIPVNFLNGYGFYMDKDNNKYDLVFLQKTVPARQVALINAEIKPDGKVSGTVQVNSFSYNRINAAKRYKTDGEKKYIDYIKDNDNNLKVSSIKFENLDIDSLPLKQNIEFNMDLTGSDDNYIYLKTNFFALQRTNVFLSENRSTDIDFEYPDSYSINGIFKEPAGYKIDALPKSVSMSMSDKGIIFRRMVAEQAGSLIVRYTVNYNKVLYFKENYLELHEFFKKMTEMMNEPIVFKKS
jgi:hypothetical protein